MLGIVPAAAWGGLPAALGIIFMLYVVNSFFLPARSAILPDLVPEGSLVEANSLATLAGVLATTIAGSLAGGMLVERLGWRIGFQSDAATYFLSVAALAFIQFKPRARHQPAETARATGKSPSTRTRGAGMALRSAPALRLDRGDDAPLDRRRRAPRVVPQVVAGRGVGVVAGVGGAVAAAAIRMVAGTLLAALRTTDLREDADRGGTRRGGGDGGLRRASSAGRAMVRGLRRGWVRGVSPRDHRAVLQASIAAEARGRVFAYCATFSGEGGPALERRTARSFLPTGGARAGMDRGCSRRIAGGGRLLQRCGRGTRRRAYVRTG